MRYTLTTPSTLWNVLQPVAVAATWLALPLALLPALWPTDAAAAICPETDAVQLTVGQTNDAGDVEVCNGVDSEGEFLSVTYKTTYPFCLLETYLHVATSVDGIPQNQQGSPRREDFEYGDVYAPCKGEDTFKIPLDAIGQDGVAPGDTVLIAAAADLEDEDLRVEEAWGDGTRFVERGNWAMYFTYTVEEPIRCGGEESKCVFVTSGTYSGDLVQEANDLDLRNPEFGDDEGLAAGDTICQALAESDGSLAASGTYKAWLSAGGEGNSAAERLTHADVPYLLVDGSPVADAFGDLTTCDPDSGVCLSNPIKLTENEAERSAEVWTATHPGGDWAQQDCGGWSDVSIPNATVLGDSSEVGAGWTDQKEFICPDVVIGAALYCFQQ